MRLHVRGRFKTLGNSVPPTMKILIKSCIKADLRASACSEQRYNHLGGTNRDSRPTQINSVPSRNIRPDELPSLFLSLSLSLSSFLSFSFFLCPFGAQYSRNCFRLCFFVIIIILRFHDTNFKRSFCAKLLLLVVSFSR